MSSNSFSGNVANISSLLSPKTSFNSISIIFATIWVQVSLAAVAHASPLLLLPMTLGILTTGRAVPSDYQREGCCSLHHWPALPLNSPCSGEARLYLFMSIYWSLRKVRWKYNQEENFFSECRAQAWNFRIPFFFFFFFFFF